jgi:biopolymer transport protein ExbD
MAIHPPGQKFRYSRILSRGQNKRGVVVTLSLTAMVDMFTVLVIFLLQNYNSTGEVLFLPKEISLPKAEKVKELKPAVVVTVSKQSIFVDKNPVVSYEDVSVREDWMIESVKVEVQKFMQLARQKAESKMDSKLQRVMGNRSEDLSRPPGSGIVIPDWKKVTVQADRGIDFKTIKKVLYTVTEAGAGEINFAVTKESR